MKIHIKQDKIKNTNNNVAKPLSFTYKNYQIYIIKFKTFDTTDIIILKSSYIDQPSFPINKSFDINTPIEKLLRFSKKIIKSGIMNEKY